MKVRDQGFNDELFISILCNSLDLILKVKWYIWSRFDWSNCGVLRRSSLSRMRMLIVIVIGVALSCFSLCPFLYGPIIFEHLWQFEWLLCHDISTSTAFNLMMTILLMKLKKKADSCERWQKRAKSETKRKCPPPEISVKTSIRRIHCPWWPALT